MPADSELRYFVHRIDGIEYGGWFRLVEPDCIEVLSQGLMTILPLDGKSVEEVSCRVLEDFVRGRLRTGAPVPPAAPAKEQPKPDHVCAAHSGSATRQ